MRFLFSQLLRVRCLSIHSSVFTGFVSDSFFHFTETAAVLIACGADVHAGEEEFSYEEIHHYFKRYDDFRDGIRGHNGENTRCEGKVTPILLAARQGHLDTFELLEQEGGQYFHHPVLFLAVKGGNLALLKKLVSRGLDVKNRDDGGRTLLHFVNSEEEAKILLDLGLDAMSTDAYDVTPLHHAAQIGNIKLADVLIEHGADVSAKTSTGWTPLVYAVINKNCSPNVVSYFAQKLRQSGRKKIASDVALHHSRSLDPEIARILIDFGFEVNKRTRQGSTPLHSAVDGEPETVKLLIENGAKIHVVNCLGNTPFHNAARLGKPETLRFLLSKDAKLIEAVGWRKRTALHFACEWGNVDCVQFLLEHGSNLKAVDSKGNNALHRAIRCGQWRSCQRTTEILLKHAADDHADNRDNIINAANKEGWTALHFAAVYGDLSLVEMLLKFGFAIDAINNNGETPLHLATDVSIVKLLVERGADTRIANKEGDTVLHVAAHYSGYSDLIVEFLLDQNFADVHSPNARGKTPLHLTSESLQCEKAEMLLQKGAQVNAMDNEGCTPLHVAIRDSYSPTFWQVLIERGADVNAADKKGNTVLHMAADKPRGQDLLSFLIERGGGHTIRNKKGKTSGDLLKSYNDHRNSRLRRFCRWNFATVLGTWIWSCRRILTLISQVIAHLGFGKTENILTHLLVFRPILPSLSLFFLLPCYFLTNSLLGRTKNCRYCRSLLKL